MTNSISSKIDTFYQLAINKFAQAMKDIYVGKYKEYADTALNSIAKLKHMLDAYTPFGDASTGLKATQLASLETLVSYINGISAPQGGHNLYSDPEQLQQTLRAYRDEVREMVQNTRESDPQSPVLTREGLALVDQIRNNLNAAALELKIAPPFGQGNAMKSTDMPDARNVDRQYSAIIDRNISSAKLIVEKFSDVDPSQAPTGLGEYLMTLIPALDKAIRYLVKNDATDSRISEIRTVLTGMVKLIGHIMDVSKNVNSAKYNEFQQIQNAINKVILNFNQSPSPARSAPPDPQRSLVPNSKQRG